jgi:flagellar motor switch protein FliM
VSGDVVSIRPWLQQKDVDALFGAAPAQPEVRTFDFMAPPRLPRERRAVIAAGLERLRPAVAALASARLRKPVEVTGSDFETVRAGDLVNAMPTPCAAWPLAVGGGTAILDLGVPFALAVVDRAFGGNGDAVTLQRALTPLEQRVADAVAAAVPAVLRDALHLSSIAAAPGAGTAEPAALPLRARDEVFVVFRLALIGDGLDTTWTIGLPLEAFEPLFETVEAAPAPAPVMSIENARELQQAHVGLVVRLPLFRVRAGNLAELAAGDTLPTGHAPGTLVEVLVNGHVRFRGTVGQVRGRLGLQITETVSNPQPARPARDREGRAL